MSKVLTISIAAYNIEDYIRHTVDSLLDERILGDIEVLICDDGCPDSSLAMAQEYEKSHPGVVRAIHKENGGYGSVLNTNIGLAKGTYFKQLDGDDWFDTEALVKLVALLKTCEADVVLTPRSDARDGAGPVPEERGWPCDRLLSPQDLEDAFVFGMWHIAVRTELIREHIIQLPEHTLYTDQLYTMCVVAHAQSFWCTNLPVYCYRIGSEGQSVTRENRIRHLPDMDRVMEEHFSYYEKGDFPEANRGLLRWRLARYYVLYVKTYLLLPPSADVRKQIKALDARVKERVPDLYQRAYKDNWQIRAVRSLDFFGYWLAELKGVNSWA